jgi:hypothetical protein
LSGRARARAKAGDGPVQIARTYKRTKAWAVKARTQAITADPALREELAGLGHAELFRVGQLREAAGCGRRVVRRAWVSFQAAFAKAADHAHEPMNRYADRQDTAAPPVREDGQRAHRPQQPDRHHGPEAGR